MPSLVCGSRYAALNSTWARARGLHHLRHIRQPGRWAAAPAAQQRFLTAGQPKGGDAAFPPVPATAVRALHVGARRAAATASTAEAAAEAPQCSALQTSAQRLHEAFFGQEAAATIASEVDAPVDMEAALARLRQELAAAGEAEEMEVQLLGEPLKPGDGRREITVPTPLGPGGDAPQRFVKLVMPSKEDMAKAMSERRKENHRVAKPEELEEIIEKYYKEKLLAKAADHTALLAAWGPKPLGDAHGEFGEISALVAQSLGAFRAALKSAKEDFTFDVHRSGDGKDCLVMPPSNFALLGLKDAVHMLLQGFRVTLVVQPRFFPHFKECQADLAECGLPAGLVEVVPGITPDADPEVLHEVLRVVDRLQFTGSSAMFKSLVLKAIDLGNLRLEHGGEVSGLNKVRLDGVSVKHPAAQTGTAWAAMANNGELCTSASLVEFDPATGDTGALLKSTLEAHKFRLGREPEDAGLDVLLKDGKTTDLEVVAEPTELKEWWEKRIIAVPSGGSPNMSTNQSLGFCIYSTSIDRALELALKEDASCLYCVGVPDASGDTPSARAGTTGCKIPESVFGGMKTYTHAVAGDHEGVGSVQTALNTVKHRGRSWRDSEEVRSKYELSETAEMLLEFLSPQDQTNFPQTIASLLDLYTALMPKVGPPYSGQALVGAEGRSQLVSLKALRPTRKSLLIPRGVGLPEEIVKIAMLVEMSPLRELPLDVHLLGAQQTGKLRVTDPLKSFLRVIEKRLGWKLHWHKDTDALAAALHDGEYPPYFFAVKDRHMLPVEILRAVAEKGGYFYEGLPSDVVALFRLLTTTQAWTVSCVECQVAEATAALERAWKEVGLRAEPLPMPELVRPSPNRNEVGGGFNLGSDPLDDKDWGELDDDESEDEAGPEEKKDPSAGAAQEGGAAKEGSSTPPAGDKPASA